MAIDPGLTFGWALVARADTFHALRPKDYILEHGVFRETNRKLPINTRLKKISAAIAELLVLHVPKYVLIEELNLGFDRQHKNRADLQKYSAAWGTIYATILERNVLLNHYFKIYIIPIPRPRPRGTTGGLRGRSHKDYIMEIVKKRYDIENISSHQAEAIYWAMFWERGMEEA